MDQMTIESMSAADSSVTVSAPVTRILHYFRERLECLEADVVNLITAIKNNDSGAITELEINIRRLYGWSELDDGGASSP